MKQNPKEAAFSHLLISGTVAHEGTFADIQAAYDIHIHPRRAMVVSADRYPDLARNQSLEWRRDIGQKMVDAVLKAVPVPFTWVWVEEGVLALLLDMDGDGPVKVQRLDAPSVRIAKAIQKTSHLLGISVSIGIGTHYDNPYSLHESFREALKSMSGRFFQGNELIFQYGTAREPGVVWDNPLRNQKTELLSRVRIGDEQGVLASMEVLLDKMAEACRHNEDMFKSEVADVLMMMSRLVLDSGANANVVMSQNAQFIHELYTTIRYDKFVQQVSEHAQWLTHQVGQFREFSMSYVIRQASRYIKEHHTEAISLDEIARYCSISKYHLSHLFKREVGIGVIDYLHRVRIEKAIYFMKTTDFTVQQIAGLVGVDDANYFSRIFKKYTGLTPREYRAAKLC